MNERQTMCDGRRKQATCMGLGHANYYYYYQRSSIFTFNQFGSSFSIVGRHTHTHWSEWEKPQPDSVRNPNRMKKKLRSKHTTNSPQATEDVKRREKCLNRSRELAERWEKSMAMKKTSATSRIEWNEKERIDDELVVVAVVAFVQSDDVRRHIFGGEREEKKKRNWMCVRAPPRTHAKQISNYFEAFGMPFDIFKSL